MTKPTLPRAPIFRRTFAWFALAAMGNALIATGASVASTPPLNVLPAHYFEAIYPFVAPAYSAELLFFTAVVALLSTLPKRQRDDPYDETDDANRLIARAVQSALTVVVSVAVVMLVVAPHSAAYVLFAALLSFVSFVLAERVAPPPIVSAEDRYTRAAAALQQSQLFAARALGNGWKSLPDRRIWPGLALLGIAPTLVQVVGGMATIAVGWSSAYVFSWQTILTFVGTSLGSVLLSISWWATCNKGDAPTYRRWIGGTFIVFAALTVTLMSAIFFASQERIRPVGWLIILVAISHAFALWAPLPWSGRRLLLDTSARVTHRHVLRLQRGADEARVAALAEKTAAKKLQGSPTFRLNLFRRHSWSPGTRETGD